MSVVILQLPKTETEPNGRPRECPYCGSHILQRWGRVTKPIKAQNDRTVLIYRYRCNECKKTFRDYPEGVDQCVHARGIRQLAALLSALGMSYRQITEVLQGYGIEVSHTTVWREGKTLGKRLPGNKIYYLQRFKARKDNIFQLYSKLGVVFALDFGGEEYVVLGVINEHNPSMVISWLRQVLRDTDIKTMRMDTGPYVFSEHAFA